MKPSKAQTHETIHLLSIVIAIHGFWIAVATAGQQPDPYPFPLVGPYAIKITNPNSPDRRYDLIDASGFGDSGIILVTGIKQVGVSGKQIFGTQVKGFFIYNTSGHRVEPQTFSDEGSWKSALSDAGVPQVIQWIDLNSMAAKLTDRQLHPFAYRVMGGTLGWSDDLWAAYIQLAGLIFMFLRGLVVRSNPQTLAVAILLGLLVNVGAQVVIAGGGPGAFVGFVITPLMYYITGEAGRLLRKLIWERNKTATTN